MVTYSEIVFIVDVTTEIGLPNTIPSILQILTYKVESSHFIHSCPSLDSNGFSESSLSVQSQDVWDTILEIPLCIVDYAEMLGIALDSVQGGPYCLVRPAQQKCTIQLLPHILYVVLVCNVVKVICFTVLFKLRFQPLVTLGDVIASFLERPDQFTHGAGPLSSEGSRENHKKFRWREGLRHIELWSPERSQWPKGATKSRWMGSMFMYVCHL